MKPPERDRIQMRAEREALSAAIFDIMASGKDKIIIREKLSAEGQAMNIVFKKATKKAAQKAFTVRKTIMVEKDGWLVMVDKAGKVKKRVKRLEKVSVPAA